MTVEFRAVTDDGQPVLDLKPDEVALRVDGRERPLQALDLFRLGEGPAPDTEPAADPLPPAYSSNAPSEAGRDVLVLLDDEGFRPGREKTIKDALTLLVNALSPYDRIGLRMLPLGGNEVPLTRARRDIRAAISKISGRRPVNPTALDLACRTRQILAALPRIFASVSRDVPAVIVLLTDGVAIPEADRTVVGSPSDLCEVRTVDFNEIEAPAINSRAQFYGVQVLEEVGFGRVSLNTLTAGLQHLSRTAGGADIVRLSGGAPQGILRVLRESSAYYVAAFPPDPPLQNGREHRLEVRVAREGVNVVAAPRVFVPTARALAEDAKLQPAAALLLGRPRQELQLRAAGYVARDVQEALKVVAVWEPVDPSVTLTSAVIGLIDATGRVRAQSTAKTDRTPMWPMSAALQAGRGPYRVRVAAVDSAGRRGTVDCMLDVDLRRAGAVRLSDVMAAASEGGPLLPRLRFGPEKVGVAYVEVYGAAKGASVEVSFEIAGSADGPPIGVVPGKVEAGGGDTRTAFGAFAVGNLPPGDYLVRAVVSVDGTRVGQVEQTLTKIGS